LILLIRAVVPFVLDFFVVVAGAKLQARVQAETHFGNWPIERHFPGGFNSKVVCSAMEPGAGRGVISFVSGTAESAAFDSSAASSAGGGTDAPTCFRDASLGAINSTDFSARLNPL
jgi:hypothetical protein